MFAVSDKVVCVDDSRNPRHPHHSFPNGHLTKDAIYCVEEVVGRSGNGIVIVGKPVIDDMGLVSAWLYTRFRKLADVKAENALHAEQIAHIS